ncbi:MAG: hypothetical protein ABIU18_03880 [Novosphingobium sp.]
MAPNSRIVAGKLCAPGMGAREYVVHSNEVGKGPPGGLGAGPGTSSTAALAAAAACQSDTCRPMPSGADTNSPARSVTLVKR